MCHFVVEINMSFGLKLLLTHVSLRNPSSLSTKMVCVAVRYKVPTLLFLGDTLSSSFTCSTCRKNTAVHLTVCR